jgi:hypothetical protein
VLSILFASIILGERKIPLTLTLPATSHPGLVIETEEAGIRDAEAEALEGVADSETPTILETKEGNRTPSFILA